jgi:SAM-dependent methyltransferase
MITREEVFFAYRLILGREPENDDVIENYCHTVHSLKELREEFIKSPEFVQKISEALENPKYVRQRHPFNLPSIPVESQVSEELLRKMFDRIYDAWEHLGFTEPYWSVLTQPQYKVNEFDKNSDQFYESSGPLFRNIISALKRSRFNLTEINTCLEVGCGVGRMTSYFAEVFKKVIAADISSEHIAKTRSYLDNCNIKNVETVHWQDLRQIEDLSNIDLVISVITLQHNPPPIIAWMLENLLKILRPGGLAFIQIPTYRNGYLFEATRYLQSPQENKIEMHFLPQSEIFRIIHRMNCCCIEVREDSMVGDEEKMLSNSFLIQKL